MEMNPDKADEEFVWGQLNDLFQKAHNDALFEILQTIAKHVGIVDFNGLSIDEFFDQRRREITENRLADFADTFPALASQIKLAWEKLDRDQRKP
jgi:hypothetical protein